MVYLMETRRLREALDEIAAERGRIEGERDVLSEKIGALDAQLRSLQLAESGLRGVLGDPPARLPEPPRQVGAGAAETEEAGFPPTKVAVYNVLRDHEGKKLTARSIEKKLRDAGLLNPDLKQPYGTVLDAARRLAISKKTPEIVQFKDEEGRGVSFAFRSKNLPGSQGAGEPAGRRLVTS